MQFSYSHPTVVSRATISPFSVSSFELAYAIFFRAAYVEFCIRKKWYLANADIMQYVIQLLVARKNSNDSHSFSSVLHGKGVPLFLQLVNL